MTETDPGPWAEDAPEGLSAEALEALVINDEAPPEAADPDAMGEPEFLEAAAAALFGIDYSYGSGVTAAQMRGAGVHFVARYLSYQPNSKNISALEFANLVKAGIAVVLVWEGTGHDCSGGGGAGKAHAAEADRQAKLLGAHGVPIYFAPCDYDAPPGDQGLINAYLDGAASVIGRGRTGFYGGYWPLSRAAAAGKATYWWQTYAWSGGNWDKRAHLQQYQNGAHLGPAEVDYDRAVRLPDYGQWPRPAAGPPPAPKPTPTGLYRHTTTGLSWGELASRRNTTVQHLIQQGLGHYTAADWAALSHARSTGAPWYTIHP